MTKNELNLFQTAFENSNEGVAIVSPQGIFLRVNPQLCRYLGYSAEELEGGHFNAVTHPDDHELGVHLVTQLLNGKIPNIKYEKRYVTKSGDEIHCMVSSRLKKDENGTPEYFITHILDITDRVRTEEQFSSVFKSMLDGYALHEIILGEDGTPCDYRFLRVNPSFERLTGLRAEDIVGKTLLEVLPNSEKEWIETYGQVALTGEEVEFESYSQSLDRHYKVSAFAPAKGQFACVFSDISERVRYEQELCEARDAAQEASRVKNEFLANMSHEVRTPLNGVLGMLQLVERTNLDEEQREYVEICVRSARSLMRILADILDLARIEAGKLEIVEESFTLKEIIDPVLEVFNGEAENRGIELICTVDEVIPERLAGDPVRLRQILYNLVGNAVKFTDQGSVHLDIFAIPGQAADGRLRVHFAVMDTGIGIDNDILPILFESFTQADTSATRRYGGTGLGLGMVKRLTGLMGGEIHAASQLGEGTEMHVVLDLAVPVVHAAPDETVKVQAPGNRGHILVAEDEVVNRFSLQRLLEASNFVVDCAEDGQQVLDMVRENSYDCILMDVQMPVLNGVETTRVIRTNPEYEGVKNIPIVALTAYAMAGDRERFMEAGMNDYIPKPVEIENLIQCLDKTLGK